MQELTRKGRTNSVHLVAVTVNQEQSANFLNEVKEIKTTCCFEVVSFTMLFNSFIVITKLELTKMIKKGIHKS